MPVLAIMKNNSPVANNDLEINYLQAMLVLICKQKSIFINHYQL